MDKQTYIFREKYHISCPFSTPVFECPAQKPNSHLAVRVAQWEDRAHAVAEDPVRIPVGSVPPVMERVTLFDSVRFPTTVSS
jgi:hypothetical protein